MENRRTFLKTSAAAALASRSVLGANNRVAIGLIGTGSRGMRVQACFAEHPDCTFLAACDVAKDRLGAAATRMGGKLDTYGDYRRVLDRKDIDAVMVMTPDHWHSQILVDAIAAGKDVYVEKPISNTIERAQKMVEAVHNSKQIVQVGLQQRSWDHFQDCAKVVQSGLLGTITHVSIVFPSGAASGPDPVQPPPPELDWEMWQGPAPHTQYQVSRQRRWRSYHAYGGGLVTDWGVHLIDIAHWFLKIDDKAPLRTTASAQYVTFKDPKRELLPDAFSVSWQYENFVMTFANAELDDADFETWGTYFHGTNGSAQVNRMGWRVGPSLPRRGPVPGAAPPPPPAFDARTFVNARGGVEVDYPTVKHTRNFLDCIKSRQKPICDIDIGFHSSLPGLLGVMAIRDSRSYTWDGQTAKPA
jgi:predicted dehydrogenase